MPVFVSIWVGSRQGCRARRTLQIAENRFRAAADVRSRAECFLGLRERDRRLVPRPRKDGLSDESQTRQAEGRYRIFGESCEAMAEFKTSATSSTARPQIWGAKMMANLSRG